MYWNIIQQQSFFFKDFFLVFADFIWQYSVEETQKQRENGAMTHRKYSGVDSNLSHCSALQHISPGCSGEL